MSGPELFIEVDDEPGTGDGFYGPQGTENGAGSGFEKGTGKAHIVGAEGFLTCEGGFAGGEADQVARIQGNLAEGLDGEGVVASQEEGRVLGGTLLVKAVAREVDQGGSGGEGCGDAICGGLTITEALAGGKELAEQGRFDFGKE